MLERAQKLWNRVKDWWKKHTPKQKTAIISISAGVLLALTILVTVVSQPKYVQIAAFDTVAEAKSVMDLLTDNGVEYKTTDNKTIQVLKKDKLNAELVLGTNGIKYDSYTINDALDGSMTTTEADKQKKYKYYQEKNMVEHIEAYEFVDKAYVTFYKPEDNGTLIAVKQEAFASVELKLNQTIDQSKAEAIARYVAFALGNETTKNILVNDTEGNILFAGDTEMSVAGALNSKADARAAAATVLENAAMSYARGLGYIFTTASANAAMSYDSKEEVKISYNAPDGTDGGLLDSESYYEETSSGGTTGIPGTDSNGETTYGYLNNENSESSILEYTKDWLQDTTTTSTSSPATGLIPSKSSIAVTMIKLTRINEDDAKNQGLLDGMSWEEYQSTFTQNAFIEVTEAELQGFANATGIPAENITVIAKEQFEFVDHAGLDVDVFDVVTILLILVILALLAYVLWTSFRTQRETAQEEELPVESLLQSAPPELEDIELETKSEARKLIEKFVEENPEAVSNLLRNWLNEDWG